MSDLADGCSGEGLILEVRHLGAPAGAQLGCQHLVQLALWHHVRTRPHALQRCGELQCRQLWVSALPDRPTRFYAEVCDLVCIGCIGGSLQLHDRHCRFWPMQECVFDGGQGQARHLRRQDSLVLDGDHLAQLQGGPPHAAQGVRQPLCVALRQVAIAAAGRLPLPAPKVGHDLHPP